MSESYTQRIEHRTRPAANLRSLENVPVKGGRITAKPVWRSDNIMLSPSEQIGDLRDLGLTTAIDLRAPDEVQINSSSVLQEHNIVHIHRPLTRKAADPKTLAKTFQKITTPSEVGDWYFRLAQARASTLMGCLEDISQAEGGVVFYCAAGKDRTGVLAACLFLLLGAAHEEIIQDYAKTSRVIAAVRERQEYATGRPLVDRDLRNHPILHADPRSMQQFLRRVQKSGGIENVLAKASQDSSPDTNTLEGTDTKIPYTLEEVFTIRDHLDASLVRSDDADQAHTSVDAI